MKKIIFTLVTLTTFSVFASQDTLINEMINTKNYSKIESLSDDNCPLDFEAKLETYHYSCDEEGCAQQLSLIPTQFSGTPSIIIEQVNKGKLAIRDGGSFGNEWNQYRKIKADKNNIFIVETTKESRYVQTISTNVSKVSDGIKISMTNTSKSSVGAIPYGSGDKMNCTYKANN